MTGIQKREELKRQGEKLKKQIAALAAQLDKSDRLRLKIALMSGDGPGEPASETTARRLMDGEYDRTPRKGLIDNMEGVLARFGKAKAS